MNEITLHALCVAIPHAIMLLYALVDILPYPKQFIHHEIRTESVECMDEMVVVDPAAVGKGGNGKAGKGKGKADERGKAFSIFEEDEGGLRSRTKVSLMPRAYVQHSGVLIARFAVWYPYNNTNRKGRSYLRRRARRYCLSLNHNYNRNSGPSKAQSTSEQCSTSRQTCRCG